MSAELSNNISDISSASIFRVDMVPDDKLCRSLETLVSAQTLMQHILKKSIVNVI
jgi:hypothetical protein